MLIHESPDAAVREFGLSIASLTPSVRRRKIRERCLEDLWFLIRVILDWGFLDETLHGQELMRFHYGEGKEVDTLTLIPRGHGKTLFASAMMIHDILKNPNIAIICVTATADLAKGIGALVGDTLKENIHLREAFPDILPSPEERLKVWGVNGYKLPSRKPRVDPTFRPVSISTAITGAHPDKVYMDDVTGLANNTPEGWAEALRFIRETYRLLPDHGVIKWSATRWHDGDPAGMAEKGLVRGKQDKFRVFKRSCFVDDDPKKGVIYPQAIRWNMDTPSGFRSDILIEEMNDPSPKARAFFSCQMRNNPVPEQDIPIDVDAINLYKAGEHPPLGPVKLVGIEVTSGGYFIFNTAEEKKRETRSAIPLEQITHKRKGQVDKADRIKATLEPVVNSGRLYAPSEYVPEDETLEGTLGYELRRLGAAKHDDIADALHLALKYLAQDVVPGKDELAHVYIACDIAYTEKESNDHSVICGIAVDNKGQVWILEIDRFQSKSPTTQVQRIFNFYLKWNSKHTPTNRYRFGNKKSSFASKYS
jgi:hypothetical protein